MPSPETLSIVVIPLIGGPALEACLRRLDDVLASHRAERLVVLACAEADREVDAWRARHPGVRFLGARHPAVPLRRRQGLEAAGGEIVALLEDTSDPAAGWAEALELAFADPEVAAAGGPVEVSPVLPARFRALGYSEYGRFLPERAPAAGAARPVPRRAERLPGNNLAYRRAALLGVLDEAGRGLVEGEANRRLLARGFRLVLHPAMTVTYARADGHGARLATRLRHGRLYAGARSAGASWAWRLGLLAKAVLLPAVLSARALGHARRAAAPGGLAEVAVWIGLMETAWALGEAVGALAGEGGSLESWR